MERHEVREGQGALLLRLGTSPIARIGAERLRGLIRLHDTRRSPRPLDEMRGTADGAASWADRSSLGRRATRILSVLSVGPTRFLRGLVGVRTAVRGVVVRLGRRGHRAGRHRPRGRRCGLSSPSLRRGAVSRSRPRQHTLHHRRQVRSMHSVAAAPIVHGHWGHSRFGCRAAWRAASMRQPFGSDE
jgi:hypothetical protein